MDRRLGVLAFGDSITNGGGELQWGVALQSWALWTARGLGLPYTGCAVDGATAHDVVARQIPVFVSTAADPEARFDVGLLYIGVNDVRGPAWDPTAYERDLRAAAAFLHQRCTRTLVCTLPLDLGRPRAPAERIAAANAAIQRLEGVLLCDLRDFGARNRVMVDAVHPTAFGQVEIAERALAVLARDGVRTHVLPSALILWETRGWKGVRGAATSAYRLATQAARNAYWRARARRAG
ncbi:MAG: GDSL-type esterase/lipase family protein, partial [Solirubrobacteraceae bacterium]